LVEIDDRQKVRLGLEFSTHELQTNFPFASSNVFQQTAKRTMSPAHIAKIRAAQKLRWAKFNAAKAKTAPVKKGGA
jgi:hypothetical protein